MPNGTPFHSGGAGRSAVYCESSRLSSVALFLLAALLPFPDGSAFLVGSLIVFFLWLGEVIHRCWTTRLNESRVSTMISRAFVLVSVLVVVLCTSCDAPGVWREGLIR